MGVWGRGWVASLTIGGGDREQVVLWIFFDVVVLAQTAPPRLQAVRLGG